jgi:hypothetical protein
MLGWIQSGKWFRGKGMRVGGKWEWLDDGAWVGSGALALTVLFGTHLCQCRSEKAIGIGAILRVGGPLRST